MKVLSINEDLWAPRMCVICENLVTHTGVEKFVIDPDREFAPESQFVGHKYVCEQCARLIANAIGTATTEQVARAEFDRDEAQAKFTALRQKVETLAKSFAAETSDEAIAYQGASFEDLFQPPNVDLVRERSSHGTSNVESVQVKESSGSARQKSTKTANSTNSAA